MPIGCDELQQPAYTDLVTADEAWLHFAILDHV
jgi:hypothetical protein